MVFAESEIGIHRFRKFPLELSHRAALEVHNIGNVDDSSVEPIVFLIDIDAGDVALMLQGCHFPFHYEFGFL